MIDRFKRNKGITLIALVITIVILIILAAVAINLAVGENGIISRAKQAALMQKRAQYVEEINLEIIQEQTDRFVNAKEEAFIVSINERLTGQKQASNESVSSYTKKSWIESTIMCDEEKEIHANAFDNNRLYIYTTEGYELVISVDNQSMNASVLEDSFQKMSDKVNVTYNSNGGTGSVTGHSVLPGFKVTLNENGFIRDKYTFTGWSLNSDGTGDKYQPGSQIVITEDTTLYATWSLNTVTVSFDNNTGLGEMSSRDISVNEATKLPKNIFTKVGYTFSKWTTNANGTGDEYTDEGNITISGDVTLYANWTAESYTITYALDGGSLSGQKTTYTIEDESFTLPTPTKAGCTFTGWTGTGLSQATLSVTVVTGSTGPRAYTATWSENKLYIIRNGVDCTSVTGGWSFSYAPANSDYASSTTADIPYWDTQNGCLKLSISGSYPKNWAKNEYAVTENAINVSGYTKFKITWTSSLETNASARIFLSETKDRASGTVLTVGYPTSEYNINATSLYVTANQYHYGTTSITNMWFE